MWKGSKNSSEGLIRKVQIISHKLHLCLPIYLTMRKLILYFHYASCLLDETTYSTQFLLFAIFNPVCFIPGFFPVNFNPPTGQSCPYRKISVVTFRPTHLSPNLPTPNQSKFYSLLNWGSLIPKEDQMWNARFNSWPLQQSRYALKHNMIIPILAVQLHIITITKAKLLEQQCKKMGSWICL